MVGCCWLTKQGLQHPSVEVQVQAAGWCLLAQMPICNRVELYRKLKGLCSPLTSLPGVACFECVRDYKYTTDGLSLASS